MEVLVASSCCSLTQRQTFCAATAKSLTLFHVDTAANERRQQRREKNSKPTATVATKGHLLPTVDDDDGSSSSHNNADSSYGEPLGEWPVRASIVASGALKPSFSASSPILSCLALSTTRSALLANKGGSVAIASMSSSSISRDLICSELFLPYIPDKSFVSSAAWSTISTSVVLVGATSGRLTLVDTEVQYAPGHGSSSSTSQALSEWTLPGRITATRYIPGTNTAVVSYLHGGGSEQRYGLLLCDPRMSDSGTAVTFGSEEPGGGDAGVDRSDLDDSKDTAGSASSSSLLLKRKKKKRAAASFFLGLCPSPYADVMSCHLNQCSVATAGGNGSGVEILQLWDVRNARQPVHQLRTRRDEFSQIEWKPNAGTLSLLCVMKQGPMKLFDFTSISSNMMDGGGSTGSGGCAGSGGMGANVNGISGGGAGGGGGMAATRRSVQELVDLMETSTASSGVTSIISSHLSVGACLPVHTKPPKLSSVVWIDRPRDAILAVDSAGAIRALPVRLGITATWGSNRQPIVALGHTVAELTSTSTVAAASSIRATTSSASASSASASATIITPPSLSPNVDIEELMMQRLAHGFSADLADALAAAGKTKEHALVCLLRYLKTMISKASTSFHCSRASGILHILKSSAGIDEQTGETSPAVRELILSSMGWPTSSTGLHLHDMTETSRDHIEKSAAIQIFTNRWSDAAQWLSIHHRVNITYGILAPLLQCAMTLERQQQQQQQQQQAAAKQQQQHHHTSSSSSTSSALPSLQIPPELADQMKNGISFWLQSAITYVMRSSTEQSIVSNAKIPFCDKIALAAAILPQHSDLVAALELLLGEVDCSFERCLLLGFGEEGITEMQRYVDVSGDFQLAACVVSPFAGKSHASAFTIWSDEYRKFLSANGLFYHRARYDLAVRKHAMGTHHTSSERTRPYCEVLCSCGNPMHEIASRPATPVQQGLRPVFSTPTSNLCKTLDCKPMCVVCSRRIEGPAVETSPNMWYAWCTTCLHGGHYQHLKEWFSKHRQCPVECCSCECCSA